MTGGLDSARFARLADLATARLNEIWGAEDAEPFASAADLAAAHADAPDRFAADLERRCDWATGSVATILGGGDPTNRQGPAPLRRFTPVGVEDGVAAVVDHARGVLRLAELRDRLEVELAAAEARVAERDARLAEAFAVARGLRGRLFAVQRLHAEREEAACGDGCCQTGTGVCGYCGEAYPCRTARVADGDGSAEGEE